MYAPLIHSQKEILATYKPRGGEKGPKIQIYKNARGNLEGILRDRHFEQINPSKALPVVTRASKNATSELQKLKNGENRAEVVIDSQTNQSVIFIGPSHRLLGGGREEEEKQFEEILQKIGKTDQHAQQARGKNLVVVLGNTGAGKSTFINYMHGCPMHSEEMSDILGEVIVAEHPVTEIGHGAISLTEYPVICPEIDGLVFADFPGFLDNRGPTFDIPNAYATRKMMTNCASIRGVVILINYHSLLADRGRSITEMESILCQLFGSSMLNYQDSIWLGITQVPHSKSLDRLKNYLCADRESALSTRELVSRLAERLFIYDPLNCPLEGGKDRSELLEILRNSPSIRNPSQVIEFALSPDSSTSLEKIVMYKREQIQQKIREKKFSESSQLLKRVYDLRVISHPAVEEFCQSTFSKVNQQLEEYVAKIAHQYSQDNETNGKKILDELSGMQFHFTNFPEIRFRQAIQEANSHKQAYESRKQEKIQMQRKAEEARRAAAEAAYQKRLAEERADRVVKNGQVISGLERLSSSCPSNMRNAVRDALSQVKNDSNYIHLYCQHTDSIDNAFYALAIRRENGLGHNWYSDRDNWKSLANDHNIGNSYSGSNYSVYCGKGSENKTNTWYDYSAKVEAKRQEERRYNGQVISGLERLLTSCPNNMRNAVRDALSHARADFRYIHLYCQHTDSMNDALHALVIRREDGSGHSWYSNKDSWKEHANNHKIGYGPSSSDTNNCVIYSGKGSENKTSKWYDYRAGEAKQRDIRDHLINQASSNCSEIIGKNKDNDSWVREVRDYLTKYARDNVSSLREDYRVTWSMSWTNGLLSRVVMWIEDGSKNRIVHSGRYNSSHHRSIWDGSS